MNVLELNISADSIDDCLRQVPELLTDPHCLCTEGTDGIHMTCHDISTGKTALQLSVDFDHDPLRIDLAHIMIAPEYRSRRIGGIVLHYVEKLARRYGAECIYYDPTFLTDPALTNMLARRHFMPNSEQRYIKTLKTTEESATASFP
ncbi:MAG: GNAT family N-acetyltransferase [Nanoarchaeota archaeon]